MSCKLNLFFTVFFFFFICTFWLTHNEYYFPHSLIYIENELVFKTQNAQELNLHQKCNEMYINLYKFHSTLGSEYPKKDLNQYNKNFTNQRKDNLKVDHVWFDDTDYLHMKNESKSNQIRIISNKELQDLAEFTLKLQNSHHFVTAHLDYEPLDSMLCKYLSFNEIASKKIALLGLYEIDYLPWIESILLKINMQVSMFVIDYQPKVYENPNIKWAFLNNYLKESYANSIAKKSSYKEYDIVISHHMIDKVQNGFKICFLKYIFNNSLYIHFIEINRLD